MIFHSKVYVPNACKAYFMMQINHSGHRGMLPFELRYQVVMVVDELLKSRKHQV
jgi:hypothetical protein